MVIYLHNCNGFSGDIFAYKPLGFCFQFIRDELKYEDGFDRHSNFHGTDDLISIDVLWKLWVQSEGRWSVSVNVMVVTKKTHTIKVKWIFPLSVASFLLP